MVRRTSTVNFERIRHLQDQIELVRATCSTRCRSSTCCASIEPDEVYNLAAQTFVPTSLASRCSPARSPPWA